MDAIRASTQRPVMSIRSRRAELNFTYQTPRMEIDSQWPEVTVSRTAPSFHADIQDLHDEIRGLAPGVTMTKAIERTALRKTQEGLAKRVRLYDQIGDLDSGVTIPQLMANYVQKPPPDINIRSLSIGAPNITWDTGGVELNWSDPRLEISWSNLEPPALNVTPPQVDITVTGRPFVQVQVIRDATPLGQRFDERI